MPTLSAKGLEAAVWRLSRVASLLAPDRVCLATSGGRVPRCRGREGFVVHFTGSSLPWFLRPLGLIGASGFEVVEVTRPEALRAFAREADSCFTVKFHSFARSSLPAVLSQLGSGWGGADPAEVADRDPTYGVFEFGCDGDDHGYWDVFFRCNRDCPADLRACLNEIDLSDPDGESLQETRMTVRRSGASR